MISTSKPVTALPSPNVSETVYVLGSRSTAPVEPPSPTLSAATVVPMSRSKLCPPAPPTISLVTVRVGRRELVIVHSASSPYSSSTWPAGLQSPVISTSKPVTALPSPNVSETVYVLGSRSTAPVEPPSPTLSAATVVPMSRSKLCPPAPPTNSLVTVRVGRRELVIVHSASSPYSSSTWPAGLQSPVISTSKPVTALPSPNVSETVYVLGSRSTAPVEPPSPTLSAATVVPMSRSKLCPPAPPTISLVTVRVGRRELVIVHSASSPYSSSTWPAGLQSPVISTSKPVTALPSPNVSETVYVLGSRSTAPVEPPSPTLSAASVVPISRSKLCPPAPPTNSLVTVRVGRRELVKVQTTRAPDAT